MTYFWRVFLWENGHKSTEYTDYAVAPIFIEDKLDETLDSGEVILKGMPISTRAAFPPKTKFRIERYTKADYSDSPKKWDFIVEHDDVEEYVGCSEICTHRISLIEPSAIAQGMHVDNIALTYELQDVDLNYRVVRADGATMTDRGVNLISGENNTPKHEYTKDTEVWDVTNRGGKSRTWAYFKNNYKYAWDESSCGGEYGIYNIKRYHHALDSYQVKFSIPRAYVYRSSDDGSYFVMDSPLFQLNTKVRVKKYLLLNGTSIRETYISLNGTSSTTIYSGATSLSSRNDAFGYSDGTSAYLRKIKELGAGYNTSAFESNPWDPSPNYTTFDKVAEASSSHPQYVTFNTDVLSQAQLDAGYSIEYEIEIYLDDGYQGGMVDIYSHYLDRTYTGSISYQSRIETLHKESANRVKINFLNRINCYDMSRGECTPYTAKGVKYSCYQLIRKALLTTDTYIVTNGTTSIDDLGANHTILPSLPYPIIISDKWVARLKDAKMQETIFEQKNLWEIFLQVGYYLHAIPCLNFAEDGTDRYVLGFKQLGGKEKNDDESQRITVFNSRAITEYFTQFDSYVTNMFSPQNDIEEWLTVKTSDNSYLISNNTAEIHTKYNISEIEEFYIIYDGSTQNAIPFIFEKSIYEVLTNGDPEQIFPAKGSTIYYTLGDNKILGLSYVAPGSGGTVKKMALKYLMQRLFGVNINSWSTGTTFNNIRFHIKYKTQDTLRVTQFRPDLGDFLKNSSYENYPHHEQFYGQQDKIIDSERFSANLWGKLVRVGNMIYQRQEYALPGTEKKSGQLVTIYGEPYYVSEIENEFYNDAVLQKVTYTKNFNQISQIVTIPSEPRFYEVSERSMVRREVRLQEFFTLSLSDVSSNKAPAFMGGSAWHSIIKRILFEKGSSSSTKLPNYAWTRFLADKLRVHESVRSADIEDNQLFPSSDIQRTGGNVITAMSSSDHADCIVPLLRFPIHNGIVFEWDMDDNFKAGDYVDRGGSGGDGTVDGAYLPLQAFRYADILGRADLFQFMLFYKNDWDTTQMQQLPKAVIDPSGISKIGVQGISNNKAIALDKDNREALSFNYQINLLYGKNAGGDEFFTFPNVCGEKDENLRVALLNKEQSMFDESVDMGEASVLAYNVPYSFSTTCRGSIEITFGTPEWTNGARMSEVKAIAFYQQNDTGGKSAFIVLNLATPRSSLPPIYIHPTFTERKN